VRLRQVALVWGLLLSSTALADGGGAAATNAWHERGRKIFNFRCYFCHGYSGNARTLAAVYLSPKPRDFTSLTLASLSRESMLQTVREGRAGTAMQGFRSILGEEDIAAVTDFVRLEFMASKRPNTRYHTPENGWPDHERYRAAYPFVLGEVAADAPAPSLSAEQAAGRRLYLETCISCHDQPLAAQRGATWEARPISFPRNQYTPGSQPSRAEIDTMASASPYLKHERAPQLSDLTALERRGEALFQQNCAFCHGADGSGKNWIGSYLEPHARNLARPGFLTGLTPEGLGRVIAEGLPGTSMPAWKSVLEPAEREAVVAYVFRAFSGAQ
jgi:cytochrome c oxidase cbb3-type subunit 3